MTYCVFLTEAGYNEVSAEILQELFIFCLIELTNRYKKFQENSVSSRPRRKFRKCIKIII